MNPKEGVEERIAAICKGRIQLEAELRHQLADTHLNRANFVVKEGPGGVREERQSSGGLGIK